MVIMQGIHIIHRNWHSLVDNCVHYFCISDLLRVEKNMILRRRRLLAALRANEIAPTVSSIFPCLLVHVL
jgi:hypothetical protein